MTNKGKIMTATTGSRSGKSSGKTAGKTAKKIREVAASEFMSVIPDVFAYGVTHYLIGGLGKLPGIFRVVFSKLGKAPSENIGREDVARMAAGVQGELAKENMPESYNVRLQDIVSENMEQTRLALTENDTEKRALLLANVKQKWRKEVAQLDQQYREEPFDIRILERIPADLQKKLEDLPMTEEQHTDYLKLRVHVKSVEAFRRVVENAVSADDLINRLKRNVGVLPKPSAEQELAAKTKLVTKLLKQGLDAADDFFKGLLPYEEIKLPNMKSKESWNGYWDRIVSAPSVQALKRQAESDADLRKRLESSKGSMDIIWSVILAVPTVQGMKIPGEDDATLRARLESSTGSMDLIWSIILVSPGVQALKKPGEDNDALKKRLQADPKFVAIVRRKLKQRNQRLRKAG